MPHQVIHDPTASTSVLRGHKIGVSWDPSGLLLNMSIPSLVGGISLRPYDLPGATVFAAAYGLLVPLLVYRLFDARWRSIVFIQATIFAIERPIMFSLRASAAVKNSEAPGLTKYFQAAFALGFLGLAHLVLNLARPVIVKATRGGPASGNDYLAVDQPRRRYWYRRGGDFLTVAHFVGIAFGIIGTVSLGSANETGPNHTHQVDRYVSCGIGLLLSGSVILALIWASITLPRIDHRAVRFLLVLSTLLTIPAIYRFVVMRHTTPDIHALTHQALNTGADKAAFYAVHLVPEWTVIFLVAIFNTKDICQMDFLGDRMWDETPKERERLEEWKRKRAAKKSGLELSTKPPHFTLIP
ncbi:hypothetical protein MSAN_00792200 [Mycena sanguinolenta]|uniref:Uncharacterized protein n=1 Tax=Mycena sanguinolenta TaxID=230812 RepID=A0A8H7DD84_9AGAR|nr:hypothetical protein MSAN_00792200 [Mycena sanguinolenta]